MRLKEEYDKIYDIKLTSNIRVEKIKNNKRKKIEALKVDIVEARREVRREENIKKRKIRRKVWHERDKAYLAKKRAKRLLVKIVEEKKRARLEGKEVGIRIGIRRGRHLRNKYDRAKKVRYGYRKGFNAALRKFKRRRLGMIPQMASVNSVIALGIIYSKLNKIVPLPAHHIAMIMVMGQYDVFRFKELKSMFEQLGGDAFYGNLSYMRRYGYIYKVTTIDGHNLWSLTGVGREVFKKLRKYIHGNYLKLNKSKSVPPKEE